jgi:uncharacterized protein YijF (DUF1287 family)
VTHPNLEAISTAELIRDQREALQDIENCKSALHVGVTTYSGGSVQWRLEQNLKHIAVIDEELRRRGIGA